jgi:hypothetical protein
MKAKNSYTPSERAARYLKRIVALTDAKALPREFQVRTSSLAARQIDVFFANSGSGHAQSGDRHLKNDFASSLDWMC